MTERLLSGFPHLSSKDDIYKGFFIPKGHILLDCTICFGTLPLTPDLQESIIVADAWSVRCPFISFSRLSETGMSQGGSARPRDVP